MIGPRIIFILVFLFGSASSYAERGEEPSCFCNIKVASKKSPVRSGHFKNLETCQKYLVEEKGSFDFWENFCEEGRAQYELSCFGQKRSYSTSCKKRTEFHQFLTFKEGAKIEHKSGAFSYHDSSKFHLRKSFSDIALFIEGNPGLTLSNSLYGGIYDRAKSLRIDLTLIDFQHQVLRLLKEEGFDDLYPELNELSSNGPIKNFGRFFRRIDQENKGKLSRKLRSLVPVLYDSNAMAIVDELGVLSKARITNPRYKYYLERYNKIIVSPNRKHLAQTLKTTFYPELKTPLTASHLSDLSKKEFETLYNEVNWKEHLKRVEELTQNDPSYYYEFKMDIRDGITYLEKANPKPDTEIILTRSAIEIFNYILRHMYQDRTDITPVVIQKNLEQWEDLVQEHSWSQQISFGDDQVLLVLRDWMKKNHSLITQSLRRVELKKEVIQGLTSWKVNRRPKRGLTLDLYPELVKTFPERPWESHFILNERGEKIVIGENDLERVTRNIWSRLKTLFSIENIASAVTATGVASLTGNAYASASATTLVHDFIVAKKYGYEVEDYLLDNTPMNLANSLVFSSGFVAGRTADAIFRGAATGAMQSLITGQDLRLGMLVGGISGGVIQQLPPEFSNWVVSGEDQNTLNIFSEIAEKTAFKGINGAIVGYYENGDWQKGLKKGALFGAGYAAYNIVIYGVRYDANAYISDEELEEYNHLHNHEEGHYSGEHLVRDTSNMSDRYGEELLITRDDIKRAQIRRDGLLQKGKPDSVLASNYGGPFGSEISMGEGYLDREETILHEIMHTRQAQMGRMQFLFSKGFVPEGFWEEYKHVGEATLPKGYYRTFIYVDLKGDLN